MKIIAALVCAVALCARLFAADTPPAFTKKPAVVKADDKIKIEFTVDRETDVAVSVEDAAGKVVRHLAAGRLGKNAPPPLVADALAQSIEWDGKDDLGHTVFPSPSGKMGTGTVFEKSVENGASPHFPFRVRVSAGMTPRFDGFLLSNPAASGPVDALAVGPKGALYLFHADATANNNMGSDKIKIIDREGRHVRAITPFPADIAPEKIKGLGAFRTAEGDLVPRVHNWARLSVYPDPNGYLGVTMSANSMPAVDSRGRVYWVVQGPALACLEADGGVPAAGVIGPRLLPEIKNLRMTSYYTFGADMTALAISGDEKYLYLAGLGVNDPGKKGTEAVLPCVFRIDIETRASAEVFVGRQGSPGKEKELLTAPRGLAVAKGLLYVADPGADRIAVFKETDRSFAGEIKVKNPQSIGVDPATGAVYVCAYTGAYTADLVKIENMESGKELRRLALPRTVSGTGRFRIAVDASAKPVRIWIPTVQYGTSKIICLEDAGDKFVDRGDLRDLKTPWAEGPRDLTIDRSRNELYVKVNFRWFRIDEPTGEINDVFMPPIGLGLMPNQAGTQLVPSPDGSVISLSWSAGLMRFDHAGKPLNWPGQTTNRIPYGGIMTFQERFLAIPRADEMYVILPNTYRDKTDTAARAHSVDVLDATGKPKRTVVWQCSPGAILRVDHRGNVYLAEPIKPLGRSYPEFFDGKLAPMTAARRPEDGPGAVFWNSYMYGSIIKFPPSGGAIWYDAKGYGRKPAPNAVGQMPADLLARPAIKAQAHMVYSPAVPVEIQGADWMRFGYAGCSLSGGGDTCMCESSGFDVDLYGRVFYPNLGQFRVEVVDAANNLIGTFGRYGNQDSGGKDALVKKPEIPLAWPLTVAVSDTHAYVADTVNRRVVKVKLAYATSETCEIK